MSLWVRGVGVCVLAFMTLGLAIYETRQTRSLQLQIAAAHAAAAPAANAPQTVPQPAPVETRTDAHKAQAVNGQAETPEESIRAEVLRRLEKEKQRFPRRSVSSTTVAEASVAKYPAEARSDAIDSLSDNQTSEQVVKETAAPPSSSVVSGENSEAEIVSAARGTKSELSTDERAPETAPVSVASVEQSAIADASVSSQLENETTLVDSKFFTRRALPTVSPYCQVAEREETVFIRFRIDQRGRAKDPVVSASTNTCLNSDALYALRRSRFDAERLAAEFEDFEGVEHVVRYDFAPPAGL